MVTLMIERRGATSRPFAVNISTNDFTNTGIDLCAPSLIINALCWQCDWFLNVDYETTLTEVMFPPSLDELSTLAFNISITDDTAVEPTEQFEVFLNTSLEAVLTEREANFATINILDNDSKLWMWERMVNNCDRVCEKGPFWQIFKIEFSSHSSATRIALNSDPIRAYHTA